jgi:hypothetical protein
VIVWDDPVNLMSYVVFVFKRVFGFPDHLARKLMLEVHEQGRRWSPPSRVSRRSATSTSCTATGCAPRWSAPRDGTFSRHGDRSAGAASAGGGAAAALAGELRTALDGPRPDDPVHARLFPPAVLGDPEADARSVT